MKNLLILSLLFVGISFGATAQEKKYKMVFDLSSADTTAHSAVLRQIRNLWKALPGTQVEVVLHGKALAMVQKDKAFFTDKINALKNDGVTFAVCKNTMKRFNLKEEDMLPTVIFVPAAIAELVVKQAEGWSYIKSGN